MAIKSMTGFGRGEACSNGVKVVVELSTVNRKQFDCSFSMPRELACLDSKLQALVHCKVSRGHVKGVVAVSSGVTEVAEGLELTAVAGQIKSVRAMAVALGLRDDLTASTLLRLPDIFRQRLLPDDPLEIWPQVEHATVAALMYLDEMRLREGEVLRNDMMQRFIELEAIMHRLVTLATAVPITYKATLEKRLAALLGTDNMIDPVLVARELAVFADRCDVSEELTRLASHFTQVTKVMDTGGACGRTLDFLCQELFREINTTGSKANDAEISQRVVEFKAGLEAIREQVQNIE